MSVDIPADPVPYIRAVISSGRCRDETKVVGEALRVFQDFESRRKRLREDVREGINSGESIPGEGVFERLERRTAELDCLQSAGSFS
jgi:putative addiction module CopG family antidote